VKYFQQFKLPEKQHIKKSNLVERLLEEIIRPLNFKVGELKKNP
jgi:hypothetical protein